MGSGSIPPSEAQRPVAVPAIGPDHRTLRAATRRSLSHTTGHQDRSCDSGPSRPPDDEAGQTPLHSALISPDCRSTAEPNQGLSAPITELKPLLPPDRLVGFHASWDRGSEGHRRCGRPHCQAGPMGPLWMRSKPSGWITDRPVPAEGCQQRVPVRTRLPRPAEGAGSSDPRGSPIRHRGHGKTTVL